MKANKKDVQLFPVELMKQFEEPLKKISNACIRLDNFAKLHKDIFNNNPHSVTPESQHAFMNLMYLHDGFYAACDAFSMAAYRPLKINSVDSITQNDEYRMACYVGVQDKVFAMRKALATLQEAMVGLSPDVIKSCEELVELKSGIDAFCIAHEKERMDSRIEAVRQVNNAEVRNNNLGLGATAAGLALGAAAGYHADPVAAFPAGLVGGLTGAVTSEVVSRVSTRGRRRDARAIVEAGRGVDDIDNGMQR